MVANEIFLVKKEFLQFVLGSSTCSHQFYGEVDSLLLSPIEFHLNMNNISCKFAEYNSQFHQHCKNRKHKNKII